MRSTLERHSHSSPSGYGFGCAERMRIAPGLDGQGSHSNCGPRRCARSTVPHGDTPEQVLGKDDIDGRTDIYALGCVAYWLLTGRYVFQARTAPEMMALHLREPPEPPSALSPAPVPDGLEELILMCLKKDRDQRPQSASELADRLLACQVEPAWTPERARVVGYTGGDCRQPPGASPTNWHVLLMTPPA